MGQTLKVKEFPTFMQMQLSCQVNPNERAIFVASIEKEWLDMKSCFHKPESFDERALLSCCNEWNENHRLVRMTMDEDGDLWLRADLQLLNNLSNPSESILAFMHSFLSAIKYYQAFLRPLPESNRQQRALNIDQLCETFKFQDDQSERCALCLDEIKCGDNCLKLPCGHFFHKPEIMRHLHERPNCPLCRQNLK